LHNSIIGNFRNGGKGLNDGGIAPCPFERGTTGAEAPFHNRITGDFLVFQNQLETNLLQLFAHPDNSEWPSIISVIIFEDNNVDEQ